MPVNAAFDAGCPLPQSTDAERITLPYGEGGRLSRQFVQQRILPRFGNPVLSALSDSAVIVGPSRLAVTVDSYTVSPLFFPGGDIGRLAVFGTANDLAVSGAEPRWLSLALLIEEGLAWQILDRVLDSFQQAAEAIGVLVVTGDTKVVPRGAVDQLFLSVTGLGAVGPLPPAGPSKLKEGDRLLVSGPVGQHGAAVLCAREGLGFEPAPVSDCASLVEPLLALQQAGLTPVAVRDATRGGTAAVLHEWSAACGLAIDVDERQVPVGPEVRAVCELLGLDPLFLACEGAFVAAVAEERVAAVLEMLQRFPATRQAAEVGAVTAARSTPVCVRRSAGRLVPLDEPAGSPLPRIC